MRDINLRRKSWLKNPRWWAAEGIKIPELHNFRKHFTF
jgi:hypothetical protein